MKITYDPKKNQKNIEERGLSFECIADIDFDTASFWKDARKDYGEERIFSLGKIEERVYALVFKKIDFETIRVISFRKANKREVKRYEEDA